MCDRWDIGGLSTNLHPQTGGPTIFIYDGHPGGVGHHAPGLPGLRAARRRRPPADRRVPVRARLPVVRAVAEVRQPQRAAVQGGRARAAWTGCSTGRRSLPPNARANLRKAACSAQRRRRRGRPSGQCARAGRPSCALAAPHGPRAGRRLRSRTALGRRRRGARRPAARRRPVRRAARTAQRGRAPGRRGLPRRAAHARAPGRRRGWRCASTSAACARSPRAIVFRALRGTRRAVDDRPRAHPHRPAAAPGLAGAAPGLRARPLRRRSARPRTRPARRCCAAPRPRAACRSPSARARPKPTLPRPRRPGRAARRARARPGRHARGRLPGRGPAQLRRRRRALRRRPPGPHAPGPGRAGRRGRARSSRRWRARSSPATTRPRGAGYYLALDAADGRSFFFAHCQEGHVRGDASARPSPPASSSAASGTRATRSGPHLHFEIWLGGWRRDEGQPMPVDPLAQLQAWDH